MPHGGRDAYDVDGKYPTVPELVLHYLERSIGIVRHRNRIQPRYHAEAKVEHMKRDEYEEDYSRHSLYCVEPVARVGVSKVIWPPLKRNEQTVKRVIDERDEYPKNLH